MATRLSQEEIKRAVYMRSIGRTYKDIAIEMGRSYGGVRLACIPEEREIGRNRSNEYRINNIDDVNRKKREVYRSDREQEVSEKDIPGEIWRRVVMEGFSEWYAVSNKGRAKCTNWRIGSTPGLILKQSINHKGYPMVGFSLNCEKKTISVHKLVTAAFIGECPDGYQVNHKNGNKKDNNIENLEYVTPSYNIIHSYENLGRTRMRGSLNGHSKLLEEEVILIRNMIEDGISQKEIGEMYGVWPSAIQKIKSGASWAWLDEEAEE